MTDVASPSWQSEGSPCLCSCLAALLEAEAAPKPLVVPAPVAIPDPVAEAASEPLIADVPAEPGAVLEILAKDEEMKKDESHT